jgi:hypothetical protein
MRTERKIEVARQLVAVGRALWVFEHGDHATFVGRQQYLSKAVGQ